MKKNNPDVMRLQVGTVCSECYSKWIEEVRPIRDKYHEFIFLLYKEESKATSRAFKDWIEEGVNVEQA
jgi:hypothetical protein